jgi:hypothetical protein
MFLLDTNHDYDAAAAEIGVPPESVGQLITPLTGYSDRGRGAFAVDNGCYKRFDAKRYAAILARQFPHRARCLFVTAPDVVGNARLTLDLFDDWWPKLSTWPVALVLQEGVEDLDIPWRRAAALFVGGGDGFKTSRAVRDVVTAAKRMREPRWVHGGRVNTPARLDAMIEMGVDSVDGSGISRYSWMRERLARSAGQPRLFADGEVA